MIDAGRLSIIDVAVGTVKEIVAAAVGKQVSSFAFQNLRSYTSKFLLDLLKDENVPFMGDVNAAMTITRRLRMPTSCLSRKLLNLHQLQIRSTKHYKPIFLLRSYPEKRCNNSSRPLELKTPTFMAS